MPIRKVSRTAKTVAEPLSLDRKTKENDQLKKDIYLISKKMDKMVVDVEHMKNTMNDFHSKLISALKPSLSPVPIAPKREQTPSPPPLPKAPKPPTVNATPTAETRNREDAKHQGTCGPATTALSPPETYRYKHPDPISF